MNINLKQEEIDFLLKVSFSDEELKKIGAIKKEDVICAFEKLNENEKSILKNIYKKQNSQKKSVFYNDGLLPNSPARTKFRYNLGHILGLKDVEFLDLSPRVRNVLLRYNISTFEKFISLTSADLKSKKYLGVTGFNEIKKLREKLGFPLDE